MGFDKAEVIADVYRLQADSLEAEIKVAIKHAAMREGGRDILKLLSQNISGVMGQTEKEVGEDEALENESKIRALRHVGTALTRVATAIQETARSQQNKIIEANAMARALQSQQDKFRKLAETTMMQARRKLELEAEAEAEELAEQATVAATSTSDEPPIDLHPAVTEDSEPEVKPARKRRRSKKNGARKEA
jgi:hypothetical protein